MRKQLRLASIVAGMAIIATACSTASTSTAPSIAPTTSAEPGASESAAPAALTGDITLWHSYGSGGGETGAREELSSSDRHGRVLRACSVELIGR